MSLALLLFGCSMAELEKFANENQLEDLKTQSNNNANGARASGKYLALDTIIKGGKQPGGGTLGTMKRLLVGPDDEVRFLSPVSVGGVDNYLYIVDAGQRTVFRYDLVTTEIEAIGSVGFHLVGDPGDIYVDKDRSFYIVDQAGNQVVHFNERGEPIQVFQDLANLSRPIAVTVEDDSENVLVADGSFSHIVEFNKFGKALRAIGSRGTGAGHFRAITAMVKGVEGLYVLDRLEVPVQVISLDGEYKYSFGESYQVFPSAIAVNDDRVVFVADKSDNTIRVYKDAVLLGVVGGTGAAPGRFREITGMWINNDLLFVADSMNRRVQVMRIMSNTPDAPKESNEPAS